MQSSCHRVRYSAKTAICDTINDRNNPPIAFKILTGYFDLINIQAYNPRESIFQNLIITLSYSFDSSCLITGTLTTQYSKLPLIIYVSST